MRLTSIRVPIRRKSRKPACTDALNPVRPILTGQQWNKSGHDGRSVVCLPPVKLSL